MFIETTTINEDKLYKNSQSNLEIEEEKTFH
jgi:hypothetical protein